MFVLRDIESVLTDEKKSSTYKIALITSIIDYVIENPEELPKNGYHQIPIIYLAKRWFLYYYPLMLHDPDIKQGNTQIFLQKAIANYADEVNDNFQDFDNCLSRLIQYRDMCDDDYTNLPLFKLLIRIREGIIEMPLQFIKVAGDLEIDDSDNLLGKYNYKNTRSNLFGILTRIDSHNELNDYKQNRELAGKWSRYGIEVTTQTTWNDLVDAEFAHIMIGHHAYENLVQLRFYIKDTLIKRWIEFTTNKYLRGNPRQVDGLVKGLLKHMDVSAKRDQGMIAKFRQQAVIAFSPMVCIYCDESLKANNFELEHFIPWSKLPIDRFWNLFPICKKCNGKKKAKILEFSSEIENKIASLIKQWVSYYRINQALGVRELVKYGGNSFETLDENISDNELIRFLIDRIKHILHTLI